MEKPVRIAITGAAGQIAYSLLFRIASGDLFPNQPIALHLLEREDTLQSLEGICMELQDCAFERVVELRTGSDPYKVFEGVDWAFLVGAKPRGPGMERKDLLKENGAIFKAQGKALNDVANKNVRVLVVGNPCNTNCLIALHNAPNLNPDHFFAMTRLDQNRARAYLAEKAQVSLQQVKDVVIWGNHSSTQVPDFINAKINEKPALETIKERTWCEGEFLKKVQTRGAEIIKVRGKSSAASAASSAIDTIASLVTPSKEIFSLATYSQKNSYGVDKDLIFSFPCRFKAVGEYEEVEGMPWDTFLKEKIKLSEKELIEERDMVKELL